MGRVEGGGREREQEEGEEEETKRNGTRRDNIGQNAITIRRGDNELINSLSGSALADLKQD